MALHGNRPIRLVINGNTRSTVHGNRSHGNRRVVVNNNISATNSGQSQERMRRIRIARLRRLRRQRLLRLRTTLPPTTTTTIPTTPEPTTSWYDSWMIEGQSSTPGGFTDSILDYNYEYKIDDY